MIIVYAAVAGQSVVKLYAAAMFPGFFLAALYLIYIITWVLIDPKIAPKLPEEQTRAPITPEVQKIADRYTKKFILALFQALIFPAKALKTTSDNVRVTWLFIFKCTSMSLVPILMTVATLGAAWWYVVIHSQEDNNAAAAQVLATQSAPAQLAEPASTLAEPSAVQVAERSGVQEPPGASDLKEPPGAGGLQEPPGSNGVQEPPGSDAVQSKAAKAEEADAPLQALGDGDTSDAPKTEPVPASFYIGFWIACGLCAALLAYYYWHFDAEQFEILNMLVRSVMPLGILTFVVLGVILFGITTATESAAVGAAGAFLMAWSAGTLDFEKIKQAVFLTAKTTSMVCWLFVGSALFSAVFAILGGQRLVEEWVLALNLTPIQFLLLSQAIIFILGWPLEWTEIIVIFVPIFLPMLAHFQIDPMLWGVMVFVNLQAAFLSPPVAMSAFYLKGVSPPHVTINQIFAGMMPYMLIVILCLILMYVWPELTLWLPNYLYGK
jgi:TRAP-type mannitol/chloroaromatic compound transport system permease large subunit